jgi:hypothetical protein
MGALYSRLVKLHPASFRARFGDEMLQYVRDEAANGRRMSWTRTYADLIRSASVQGWKEKSVKRYWPFGVALFVLFLATRVIVGSGFSAATALVLAAEIGIAAAIAGIAYLVSRTTRGAEHAYGARRFRWWWVPAGAVGLAETVTITWQLIAVPKGTNVFAFFLVNSFAALIYGGLAIRNRRTGNWMIAAGTLPVMALFWMIYPALVALLVIVMALSDNMRATRAAIV